MSDKYKLYQGDCLDIMPTLGKVDAVITDPPYGINYQSARRTDSERFDVLDGDDFAPTMWIKIASDITSDTSCLFMFSRWDTAEEFRKPIDVYWKLQSQVIWDRGNHGLGDLKNSMRQCTIIAGLLQGEIINFPAKDRSLFTEV